ncbi:MAG: ATP synthase F1 subunit gamma [Turicibacter sp.]|nr:ATP synthase F1 subunit gamma [Turicibacter sp.]
MAQSMKEIKDKISATTNMSKITGAMHMVATAKLIKFEQKTSSFWDYLQNIEEMMGKVTVKSHPFFQHSNGSKPGYLVLTSARGLAGGYNNNILKLLQNRVDAGPCRLYMLGSKGFEYAKTHGLSVENKDIFIPDDVMYNDIRPVIDQMLADFAQGLIDKVVVIYTNYVSKILQVPEEKQILPIEPFEDKGKKTINYLMEPSDETVLEVLIPLYLEGVIYGTVMTSKLSEQAARMSTMQNATDNAGGIIHDLQLLYNRARQAAITEEINEIVGGASAI